MSSLDIALAATARGWYVFPVIPGTKRPAVKWHDAATTDAEQVATWFTGDHADSLVGIHTGKSGLVVVDIDVKDGRDGWANLLIVGIQPQVTYGVDTPSGGHHLYYAAPKGEALTVAQDYPVEAVDIRSGVGYVVAYSGPDNTPLAPAPEWSLKRAGEHASDKGSDATLATWLERANTGKPSKSVTAARDAVTAEGMGHDAMLAAVTNLIQLGTEPGARDAFLAARETYTSNYPDHAEAWDAAAAGSVRRLGLPPVTLDIPKPERKAIKRRNDPGKAIEHAVSSSADYTSRLRALDELDPEVFFDSKLGLQSLRLASAIDGDLAIGTDGLCWEYRSGVWSPNDTAIETRTIHALGDRYRPASATTMRSVLMNGGGLPELHDDPNEDYLNVKNGMLDWRTGDLLPHDPAYLSTIQLDVEYDPDAEAPYFEAWLAERVPADAYKVVLEVIGYLMRSGNPDQKAVLLIGPGSNGKSTLLRLIKRMAGKRNVSGVTLRHMSDGKFETAGMYGKLMNIAGDIDSKYLGDASTFKQITGGDPINAQHKHGKPFEFTAWAVPVFSANKMWASSDTSDGYFRRWLTIPFPYELKNDPTFSEKRFEDELPGILNLAVRGLQRLENRGGTFKETESIRRLFAEFRAAADVVATWLDDDERVVKHPSDSTARESRYNLYKRFQHWAADNGYSGMASATFYERLAGLKYHQVKSNGTRMFAGLTIDAPSGNVVDFATHHGRKQA